jgi:transcriptional regulator with XRE-family HTH domain
MKKRRIIAGKELGAIIKRRRKELGMSQEALAVELGVTYQQVQRYENGTNKLNVDNLQTIAGILQISVTAFFEGLPEPGPSIPVTPDEMKLLKAYRGIKNKGNRNLMKQVARALSAGN